MSSSKITEIITNAENFLHKNENSIFLEHQLIMLENIEYLKPFINLEMQTTRHGCHYVSCPWSNEKSEEGPDTCKCYKVEIYRKNLSELINLYEGLIKRLN